MQKVIAIDGPSASGKGTVAARVAQALGWAYLDSGALYRLIALHSKNQQVEWHDEVKLAQIARDLPVVFDDNKIFLNQEDVSDLIRQEQIGMGASAVAKLPAVREALLQRQRNFLTEQGLVCDGRDMASVVFPDAALKIFLTASPEIRAERRAKQIHIPLDSIEFKQILSDIQARDEADRNRAVAPLCQQPDALLLDTSDLSIDEAVKKVLDWYSKKIKTQV